MNCYAMSKTNKNTRTLRKYIWRIWQATSKNHKKKNKTKTQPKNKKKKRNLNALHEFAARVHWTVDPFSQPLLPLSRTLHLYLFLSVSDKKLQRQNRCAKECERVGERWRETSSWVQRLKLVFVAFTSRCIVVFVSHFCPPPPPLIDTVLLHCL